MHAKHKDGANLRAALKAVARHGVCPEKDWPFSLTKAAMAEKPNHRAYQVAEHHKITRYERIVMGRRSRAEFLRLMKCRLAEGFPFSSPSWSTKASNPTMSQRQASCPCPSGARG